MLHLITEWRIENRANQLIGGCFRFKIDFGSIHHASGRGTFVSGPITFLPPPTKADTKRAIDLIINTLIGAELIEPPPAWESRIDIPGLETIEDKIQQKEREKEEITKEIERLQSEKDKLIRFRRLLWTKGPPLENAVRDAFIFFRFP